MPRGKTASHRRLTTVLFTDVVGSTRLVADLGDRRWRQLIGRHHPLVRRALKRHGGRELDTAGDDPRAVAVGEGSVWVANGGDGTVSRIDPVTNRSSTIKVRTGPSAIAVGGGDLGSEPIEQIRLEDRPGAPIRSWPRSTSPARASLPPSPWARVPSGWGRCRGSIPRRPRVRPTGSIR